MFLKGGEGRKRRRLHVDLGAAPLEGNGLLHLVPVSALLLRVKVAQSNVLFLGFGPQS